MPFLPRQLEVFEKCGLDWLWLIAEGAAANTHCTAWCRAQQPRLSRDGTTEWLNEHRQHQRIRVFQRQSWDGKVAMCNTALKLAREPGILLQVDADEIWTPQQLRTIHEMFDINRQFNCAFFACRYFVGPNLVVLPENDPINNVWLRAWRYSPGDTFRTHEPPNLRQSYQGIPATHIYTIQRGLVFDHFSYHSESQVAYKEDFYGGKHKNAVLHWKRLQKCRSFPVKLKDFFPWAKDGALVTKL